MKWIRENMNQINLVEEGKKIAYIAYINWEWKLFEGGEEWCVGLKVYNSHQVEEAQRAAVNELIRYHKKQSCSRNIKWRQQYKAEEVKAVGVHGKL